MKIGYLTKILRSVAGKSASADPPSNAYFKLSPRDVTFQNSMQNLLHFSTTPEHNAHEHENDEGIYQFNSLLEDQKVNPSSEISDKRALEMSRAFAPNHSSSKHTIQSHEQIMPKNPEIGANSLDYWKKSRGTSQDMTIPKAVASVGKIKPSESRVVRTSLQEVEDNSDLQGPKEKRIKRKAGNQPPLVEVIDPSSKSAVSTESSDQSRSQSLISEILLKNSSPQEPGGYEQSYQSTSFFREQSVTSDTTQPHTREKAGTQSQQIKITLESATAEKEKLHGSETYVKSAEAVHTRGDNRTLISHFPPEQSERTIRINRDNSQKQEYSERFQLHPIESGRMEAQKQHLGTIANAAKKEVLNKPLSARKIADVVQKRAVQKRLNGPFFTHTSRSDVNRIAKLGAEIIVVKKKLNEHIREEQSKPLKPVFLPKRPPSRNLGGWSNLERAYIK